MGWLFIHGVTIRRDRFERLLDDVRKGFSQAGSREEVSGCYWGDLGRSERYTGASIPGLAVGRRAAVPGAAADWTAAETAILGLLLEDPLAELAALRDPGGLAVESAAFEPVPEAVVQRNRALGVAAGPIAGRVTATNQQLASPPHRFLLDMESGIGGWKPPVPRSTPSCSSPSPARPPR
jgi:hypothetical protein